jgi:putative SOS response-associated peptidase YedK
MCGRYASARKRIELLEEFDVQRDAVTEPLQPDYNVAPTKPVYAVLERTPSATGRGAEPAASDANGAAGEQALAVGEQALRELRVLRWGLVPFWAKDPRIGSRMINARAETVADKPAFRRAFARRRCLLPADGYYEWQAQPDAAKQPVYITPRDGRSLAFAGLYELWRDPALASDDPDSLLWTATIITTTAPDEFGVIHDRMPMIIDPDRWADWLDPVSVDPADARTLLVPAAVSGLRAYPVSTLVNAVRNNGPQLIEPLAGPLAPVPAVLGPAVGAELRFEAIPSNGDDGAQALF